MSLSRLIRRAVACGCLAAGLTGVARGQNTYATNGGEYAITGNLPGDQVHPAVCLATNGGYLVWEDNVTDGYGLGISAQRLDSGFSAYLSPFRVNQTAAGDQEKPQVAMLNDGGAAFVWQGGEMGYQHIYARFLSPSNTWLSADDLQVNTYTNTVQIDPAIATLANGNLVVVWSSFNQQSSNSLQDVYGQLVSSAGQKIGGEFLVNQFTAFNQRTPSVAALSSGGFVVVWVSEQERSGSVDNTSADFLYSPTNFPSVDIYARLFSASGTPAAAEFRVNTGSDICANPRVAASPEGGFMVAWGQKNLQVQAASWDIFARPFSDNGAGGAVQAVNTYLYGDQYAPQISALDSDYLVVWTSLAQDGSREGVFGRFLQGSGVPISDEFMVNTTTVSQQMHPAVTADGSGRFLVAWTSFIGGASSFDLFAQRYVNTAQPLLAMNAPFVYVPFTFSNAVYQPRIQVSWPFQSGLPIDHYEVYVDGSPTPAASLTTNIWLMTATNGLAPSSTHSFRVAYVVTDGRRSPLSPAASASTWSGYSWGGIPFEWMSFYYGGDDMWAWPSPNAAVAPGGPSLLQVFLTGASPLDSSTWLRVNLVGSPQGYFLAWNPQPGLIYQVQTTTNLSAWTDVGGPRFAAEALDSVFVGVKSVGYYRVLRLR